MSFSSIDNNSKVLFQKIYNQWHDMYFTLIPLSDQQDQDQTNTRLNKQLHYFQWSSRMVKYLE